MAAPTLVESYAVLTRLPPPYRLRPADALAVMEVCWARAAVVTVSGPEVWGLLRRLPAAGIGGGHTCDALIVTCARQAAADLILTWNIRDFERIAEGMEVVTPAER